MAITAAENIVIHEGYHQLNARRVAAQIGYTVGTLYLLFKNFDELILQLNGRTLDALYHALETQLHTKGGLKGIALAYLRFAEENANRWKLLYHYHPAEAHRPDWYQEKIGRLLNLIEAVLRHENIELSAEQYHISAISLWGAIHGICSLKMDERLQLAGKQPAEELVSFLIERFLHGS